MAFCKDPRLTYLNESGFNVVRLPRKGIVPLGVIGRDHKAKIWLGTLDQIWSSDVPAPTPGAPQPAAGVSGTKTSDIKLSFGLDILANAINGMFGGTAPSLDFAYKNAKSVQFAFRDVRSVRIDPFLIGNFLAKGDVRPNPIFKHYFSGQNDIEAWVISEILEAKSIGVVAKRDSSTEVAVEVEQIQATLGAKVDVSSANASKTDVTYEGQEYLTFGFKAFGIGMVDGSWQIYGLAEDEGVAFAAGQEPEPRVNTGELVDLSFDTVGV
jgi:hypothetical protein